MLSAVNQAIRNTIAYADVFSFPLTLDELHKYLHSPKAVEKKSVERAARADKMLIYKDGYFVLRGRSLLIAKRKKNASLLKKKLHSAGMAVGILRWIPTISAIFVTGSVAANNVVSEDDIDFLVITKPGRLWATRLAVILVSKYFGKYRTRHSKRINNLWCFNMWLDETSLAIPPNAHNLYTAHEVAQALPVLDRHSTHTAFLAENRWVKKYLPNTQVPASKLSPKHGATGMIEKLCFAAQCWYMRSALTTEKIGLHYAFFHPRNTGEMILTAFEQRKGKTR